MTEKLVTLKTFMFPNEAYPLMTKLNSEGITCFLDGENTISVDPFLSNAIGGVKLNIKESDLEKALEILRLSEQVFEESNSVEKKVPTKFSRGYVKVKTFCQECDSINIYRKKFPFYKAFIALFFAIIHLPLAFLTKTHYCGDCGRIWKQ